MKYLLVACLWLCVSANTMAQFSNRYPKVKGMRHHIYLEGFDFPFYSNGPVSPVASPDGKYIAFSAFGWLWRYEVSSKTAKRLTMGGAQDFLPAWSPDGKHIAFVRDTRQETMIMDFELASGKESVLVDHPNASELDPCFSADGTYLYYASSNAGTFDIWRMNLGSKATGRVTENENGQEFRPVPAGSDGLYYISKSGAVDQINYMDLSSKEIRTIDEGRILSQLWFDIDQLNNRVVFNWPTTRTWELYIQTSMAPAARKRLYSEDNYVLYPSWNASSNSVLYSLAGDDKVFRMFQISVNGGVPVPMTVERWDWAAPMSTLEVNVTRETKPSPARVVVETASGHFMIPTGAVARFDSQQGEIFFYTDGHFTVQVPSEKVRIKANHGLLDIAQSDWVDPASVQSPVNLQLPRNWTRPNWYAGEHHFHLNYGGPFKLQPEDLLPVLKGEALDFATPMSANLHLTLKDEEMMNWQHTEFPKIRFGQEVRSHFHGHIGLFGGSDLFWPWFWGPVGYEVHTYDDRANQEVLQFARSHGLVSTYVHPISDKNPMADDASLSRMPVELVADAVNGELDALEVACLWSDELGSSMAYHHLLNVGIKLAMSAGTDAFPNYGRSMAVGTSRIYVQTEMPDWESYLRSLKAGRSFVTTGPMLDLKVEGMGPGQVMTRKGSATWTLDVASANELDHVELIVNGSIVWESKQKAKGGHYTGKVKIPAGGWIAARVYGPVSQWPLMDSYPFAETSPVWIGEYGSTDPEVKKKSAAILLKALQLGRASMIAAYRGKATGNQEAQFQKAQEKLQAWSR